MSQNARSIPQVALAVLGTPGSGKSTFVQHALDLKRPSKGAMSTKKVSLEGVVSLLRIYEFNIFDVDITSEAAPQWPHPLGEDNPSQIDGVMLIYSISDASSTKPIPPLLRKSACLTVLTAIVYCSASARCRFDKHSRLCCPL